MVIDALARQVADRIGYDVLGGGNLLGEDDLAEIRQELRESPRVRSALEEFWPLLTPQELLDALLSSPRRLAAAGRGLLTAQQRESLLRPAGGGWTPADVPLLDEAAELLGEDDRAAQARGERERRRRIAYARGVLDLAYGSRSVDLNPEEEAEVLSAYDILDAERLADRYEEEDDRTAVERAAADRTWAFGHIVVDEAQEALADGVADADPALPGQIDDGRRVTWPRQATWLPGRRGRTCSPRTWVTGGGWNG